MKHAVTCAALLALGALPLVAQPGFESSHDYQVVVDGEVATDAELFWNPRARQFLIIAPQLATPVLLSPPTSQVQGISIMRLSKHADGSVEVLSGDDLVDQGSFRFENGVVRFDVGGHALEMREAPPLLGWQTTDEIRAYSATYERRAAAYEPDRDSLSRLRELPTSAKLTVYFGSWCPHCQELVPAVLTVADLLSGSNVDIVFYGLPRAISQDPLAQRNGISSVPTGVLEVDGREIGRVSGNGWRRIEATLDRMLH